MTSAQRGKRYWKVKEQNEAERESNWFRSQHKARYKLAMLSERVFFSRVDWDPKIHKSCFQLMVGFSFPSQSARSHALRFLRLVGNRPKKRTFGRSSTRCRAFLNSPIGGCRAAGVFLHNFFSLLFSTTGKEEKWNDGLFHLPLPLILESKVEESMMTRECHAV